MDFSRTHQTLTIAQQEARRRKASYSEGTRKSRRSTQRINTSKLRRINEIFWKGDKLFEDNYNLNKGHINHSSNPKVERKDANCLPLTTTTHPNISKYVEFPNTFNFGGRLKLRKIHDSPHIYSIDDFLSEKDMNYIEKKIDLANEMDLFNKSFVDDTRSKKAFDEEEIENGLATDFVGNNTTSLKVQEQRTSTFVNFSKLSDRFIASLENRVAELLSLPNHCIEPIQLLKYKCGQYFREHHDLGVLFEDGSVELPMKGVMCPPRRLVSILVYLNDLSHNCGGSTNFPLLKEAKATNADSIGICEFDEKQRVDGLFIRPKRGMAVIWCNVTKDGLPDERLIHSGEKVKCGSTKYALNIWACEE